MSVHVSSRAWKRPIGDFGAKLVFVKLADNANDQGWAWPARKTIAVDCEMSIKTVDRKIAYLVHLGELFKEKRGGVDGGRQTSNRYLLVNCIDQAVVVDGSTDRSTDGSRVPLVDAPSLPLVDAPQASTLTPPQDEGGQADAPRDEALFYDRVDALNPSHKQRARALEREQRERVLAWLDALKRPPVDIRNPAGWFFRGIEGNGWPPAGTFEALPNTTERGIKWVNADGWRHPDFEDELVHNWEPRGADIAAMRAAYVERWDRHRMTEVAA